MANFERYPEEGPLRERPITKIVKEFISGQNEIDSLVFEDYSKKSRDDLFAAAGQIQKKMDDIRKHYRYISNHKEEVINVMGEEFDKPLAIKETCFLHLDLLNEKKIANLLAKNNAYKDIIEKAKRDILDGEDEDES